MVTSERSLHIVRATSSMAPALAAALRPTDAAEVIALRGPDLTGTLSQDIAASCWSFVALEGPVPVAIWGVCPAALLEGGERFSILGGVGAPWCLTTPAVERHARAFARGSRRWVELMRGQFDELHGLCDARHVKALRWLKWLGFELASPGPCGDTHFYPFGMVT